MKRSRRSYAGSLVLLALGSGAVLGAGGGCGQQTVPSSLRALERSGRVSFVCLGAPGVGTAPGLGSEQCSGVRYTSIDDYGVVNGVTTQPHLYALVTQMTRGEVAVIDLSSAKNSVLDQNPRVPGSNFLPIGAQPVDIVSTAGGNATFVAVAEVGRAGIFALPSKDIRSCEGCEPKTFTSWPACALPGAPGEMVVMYDAPNDAGEVRASCEGAYEPLREEAESDGKGGYLVDLTREGKGRPKLVVTIPDLGAMAVVDAQALFDVEREADGSPKVDPDTGEPVRVHPPGSWEPCPIDRWLPLSVELPASGPPVPPPSGAACVAPAVEEPGPELAFTPRPAGMAVADEELFIADLDAPVIHVFDMSSPCEPIEREPLLPTSIAEPSRVVTTGRVAVSPILAGSLDRFVYATDEVDGSVMVFDIGASSTSRRPITRPHPEWTPSQAPDRIEFGVPVQDLVIVERDNPQTIPATGVTPEGIRCSPDPSLVVCNTSEKTPCDPETLYRTSSDFDRGAGPTRMRGAFAYVVLGTGQIAIVDIDDYDALCRAPTQYSYLFGCPPPGAPASLSTAETLVSSGEVSCNVVVPHAPREANYLRTSDRTGQNQPGLTAFPLLYDRQGTLQSGVDLNGPLMRATVPSPPDPNVEVTLEQYTLAVGGTVRAIDQETGLTKNAGEIVHTVAMNFENPRAHTSSQTFTITYEGALPGFSGKAGRLDLTSGPTRTLSGAASRFCDQGVLGERAWKEILAAEPADPDETVAQKARRFADYVQITSNIPDEDDVHWSSPDAAGQCTYQECKLTFGSADLPKEARDITIAEAYQDRLELGELRGSLSSPELIECCFPSLVGFQVRAGGQWTVVGQSSGFLHHVIPTPESSAASPELVGACRNSCDPMAVRKNGRVRPVPHGTVVKDGELGAFINPFFRIAINDPAPNSEFDTYPLDETKKNELTEAEYEAYVKETEKHNSPPRGTLIQFATQGSFRPLVINLASSSTEIQPQAITFVPSTSELAITDGSLQGLILLSAGRLDITRQYY